MKNKLKKLLFKPDFYYESAQDFCYHTGLNPDQIAEYTGVTIKTAARWIKENKHPRWLLPFLWCCVGGVLCPEFCEFRLIDGLLTAPTLKGALTASQIAQYSWHLGALALYQVEIERLTRPQKSRPRAALLKFPDIC